MNIQHLLEGLEFYLLPSLSVALIPTIALFLLTWRVKPGPSWRPILFCLFAGLFMWCYLAYWSTQGFLIFPLGIDAPRILTIPFILLGGIAGGGFVYAGTKRYQENRKAPGMILLAAGYLILVWIVFLILNNRGVA